MEIDSETINHIYLQSIYLYLLYVSKSLVGFIHIMQAVSTYIL